MTIDEIKTIGVVGAGQMGGESRKCLLRRDGMSCWWT